MMKKRCLCFLLAAACLLAGSAPALAVPSAGYANLRPSAQYEDGVFSDVPADSAYRDSVAAVYGLGLLRGTDGVFHAEEPLSVAEALAVACRLHSLYQGGTAELEATSPWYLAYAAYAEQQGIYDGTPEDYGAPVLRGSYAAMLAAALPPQALPTINEVSFGAVVDVSALSPNAEEIYRLYRAGIVSPGEGRPRFVPYGTVTHLEAAELAARMAYRSLRLKFTLPDWPWPDLKEQSRAEDGFFSGSAMLGASLVSGMSLYSGLRDVMDFYCETGSGISGAGYWTAELCKRAYDRVYIQYGADDLYMQPEDFAAAMEALVTSIRTAMPDADIYVTALPPVTKERSGSGEYPMETILAFNEALYRMCEKQHCWYLDICMLLSDGEGYLPEEYAGWDGSPHLSEAGYSAWEEAMRTRYAS